MIEVQQPLAHPDPPHLAPPESNGVATLLPTVPPLLACPQEHAEKVVLASAEEDVKTDGVSRLPALAQATTPQPTQQPEPIQTPEPSNAPQAPQGEPLQVPLTGMPSPDTVQMHVEGGLITLVARDAPLGDVLALLARQQGLNMIIGENIQARVSVTLTRVPIQNALANILAITGYTAVVQPDNTILITSISSDRNKVLPTSQGRAVQVFRLDYTTATDVNAIVKGLLSPAGQSFVSQIKDADNRRTQEVLVVEDVPWNLERIACTVKELDVAPRQVLIEAKILTVELTKDNLWGVNLKVLANADPSITLRTDAFADAAAYANPNTTPSFFFNLSCTQINQLVQALLTTNNAKTLATPKVFAINGQQARVQVGEQIGYNLTTTTQTSTMQSVNFLNVGTILTVTPQITPDNQILMKVKPEVSTGEVDAITKCPNSKTTQVETSVLLPDGHGIVIGGLITESDTNKQTKVPFLGDLWLVGWMFQHRETHRTRNELIITLIPHIVPYQQPAIDAREAQEFQRSVTPLLEGPLCRTNRPWEPNLRDTTQPPAALRRWCGDGDGEPIESLNPANGSGGNSGDASSPRKETIPAPPGEASLPSQRSAQRPTRLPPVTAGTR